MTWRRLLLSNALLLVGACLFASNLTLLIVMLQPAAVAQGLCALGVLLLAAGIEIRGGR